jgi:uncharacterized repeat protein (TIGR01451 family)
MRTLRPKTFSGVLLRLLLPATLLLAQAVQAAPGTDLSISKVVDNALPREGDTLLFSLTLVNNGPKNTQLAEITDLLPAGLTYVSHVGDGTYDPLTGIWSAGKVAVGATAHLDITATVDAGTAGATLTNTATLTSTNHADPVPGNDSSSVDITVVAPNLTTVKSAQTTSDPVNGTVSPYNIPGATVLYSIQMTNTGLGAPDGDTVTVTDAIPAGTELFVGDLGASGSGPVLLIDGSGGAASGLTYSFAGLASVSDDIEFSNDSGATWVYSPTPDVDGYDASVTDIRVNPKGAMRASDGTVNPTFTLRFRVRVK